MAVDIVKSLNIEARINELRDSLGEALRSRVVGPDADTRVQQIMEVGGPRWYSDVRPIRIVLRPMGQMLLRLESRQCVAIVPTGHFCNRNAEQHPPWQGDEAFARAMRVIHQ